MSGEPPEAAPAFTKRKRPPLLDLISFLNKEVDQKQQSR